MTMIDDEVALPPGFSKQGPTPLPQGFSKAPPAASLPEGFSKTPPVQAATPLPEGFTKQPRNVDAQVPGGTHPGRVSSILPADRVIPPVGQRIAPEMDEHETARINQQVASENSFAQNAAGAIQQSAVDTGQKLIGVVAPQTAASLREQTHIPVDQKSWGAQAGNLIAGITQHPEFLGGPALAGAAGAIQGLGEGRTETAQQNAGAGQAAKLAIGHALIEGVSNAVLAHLLGNSGAGGGAKEIAGRIIKQGAAGAGVSAAQTTATNVLTGQPVGQNVGKAALQGGLTQAGFGAVHEGISALAGSGEASKAAPEVAQSLQTSVPAQTETPATALEVPRSEPSDRTQAAGPTTPTQGRIAAENSSVQSTASQPLIPAAEEPRSTSDTPASLGREGQLPTDAVDSAEKIAARGSSPETPSVSETALRQEAVGQGQKDVSLQPSQSPVEDRLRALAKEIHPMWDKDRVDNWVGKKARQQDAQGWVDQQESSLAESRAKSAAQPTDEDIKSRLQKMHEKITAEGGTLDNQSESGSRYYTMPDGDKVRVSDHAANAATQDWIDRNNVTEYRVDQQRDKSAAPVEGSVADKTAYPQSVNPLHGIEDKNKLSDLTSSMQKSGWQGRPLLVEPRGDGYQGVTGSHRTVAAQRSKTDIPIVEIDQSKWNKFLATEGTKPESFTDYLGSAADDTDRVRLLDKIGDKRAADLMRREISENEQSTAPAEKPQAGQKIDSTLQKLQDRLEFVKGREKPLPDDAERIKDIELQIAEQKANPKQSGRRRKGFVATPDLTELRASTSALRSEFQPIAIRYGEEPTQHLNRMAATPNETNSVEANFRRATVGNDMVTYAKAIELGLHYRGDLNVMEGKPRGSGLPNLSAAEVAKRMADPKIQAFIKRYNANEGPFLEQKRRDNGMPMNPNSKKIPFFLNAVGDFGEPGYGGEDAAKFNKPFTQQLKGNADYETDPIKYMKRVIGAHLKADANIKFKDWAKANGLDFKSQITIPPTKPGEPDKFVGTWNGKKNVEMAPIDINKGLKQPVIDPLTKKPVTMSNGAIVMQDRTPDLRYVPREIADKAENIRNQPQQRDTIVDKYLNLATRFGLTLKGLSHVQRNVAAVAASGSQDPVSIRQFLPSWIGNKGYAAQRMIGMAGTPLGEAMQLGVDRSGSARGSGYNIPEAQSTAGKILNLGHDAIMHPVYGSDPNGRRELANVFYRKILGHDVVNKAETRVGGGESPLKVGEELWDKLDKGQQGNMGQYINSTMGFLNSQSRSDALNTSTRFFPFLGSEAGMIPNELKRFLTLNTSPSILKKSVVAGQYRRAGIQLAGQLASGAGGAFLTMQALNLMGSTINGHPRFTWNNDEGHKLDVELPIGGDKPYFVGNLAPDVARAARLTGAKAFANKDVDSISDWAKTIGREGVNEVFSALAPGLRTMLSVALGKEMYWDKRGRQPDTEHSSGIPVVGKTVQSVARGTGVGQGLIQDAGGLAGYSLTRGTGRNYSDAMRKAIDLQDHDDKPPSEQTISRRQVMDSLRQEKDVSNRRKILVDAVKSGKIPGTNAEINGVMREVNRSPLTNAVENVRDDPSLLKQIWDAATSEEKKELRPLMAQKIFQRAKNLTFQQRQSAMQWLK